MFSSLKVFFSTILRYDLYNIPLHFKINNQKGNTTVFSQIISKIIIIIIVFFLMNSLLQLFSREKPLSNSLMYEESFVNQRIYIDSNNFHVAVNFKILNNKDNYIDFLDYSDYLSLSLSKSSVLDEIDTEFNYSICNREISGEKYDKYQLNKSLCIKSDYNFYLGESNFVIKLNLCKNHTKNTCKSTDEIISWLNSLHMIQMQVFTEVYLIDVLNYNNPQKKTLKYSNCYINADMLKEYHFFIKKGELQTNDNYLLSSIKQEEYFTFDKIDYDFIKRNYEDDPLIVYYIMPSNVKETYTRTYPKLPDILASIGGFSQTIILIGFLLTYNYNSNDLVIKTSSYVWRKIELESLDRKTIINCTTTLQSQAGDGYVAKRRKLVNFSFFDRFLINILPLMNKTKEKYDIFNKYKQILRKKLDFKEYTERMDDIYKLRKILFNGYQIKLFDFVQCDYKDKHSRHLELNHILQYIKDKEERRKE